MTVSSFKIILLLNLQETEEITKFDIVQPICKLWVSVLCMIWILTIPWLDNNLAALFSTVLFMFYVESFDWRPMRRNIAFIFHVSNFLFWEFMHGITIYALYKVFRESNSEWGGDVFRASCETTAIIISLHNSILCSWKKKIIIYCIFKGVSKLKICIDCMLRCDLESIL